jgi:4-amino-4-deoxy-L-arabinose transferase-like glycosyltransferase
MQKRALPYLTIVLLLAGLILRLMGLNKGIWVDEWSSIYISQAGGILDTLARLRHYDHPPIYYMMLHLWSQLGNSEFFLRLPSVFMGIGTVFVAMMWLRLYSSLASVLMGVLLGAAPMLLRYSQEIRDYPLLLLATSLTFLFASIMKNKPEKTSGYIGLGLSLALAVATHLVGVFLVLPVCAFLYTLPSQGNGVRWSKVVLSLSIPIGTFLFLYFFFLLNLNKSSDWWVPQISPSTIALTASGLFGLSTFPWPWIAERAAIVALPFFAIALAFGDRRSSIPFLFAAITYWLQIIAYSILITPILLDRVLLPSLIPLAGFAAIQIASTRRKSLRTALIAACIVLSLASALDWAIRRSWEPIEPWKQMSSLLESHWTGNGLLIFYPDYCAGPVQYYFTRLRLAPTLEVRPRTQEEELGPLISSRVNPLNWSPVEPHVFLIVRYDTDTSKDTDTLLNLLNDLREQISRRFSLTILSFGIEPSKTSSKAMASIIGLPSRVQVLGTFTSSQYQLHSAASVVPFQP